MVCWRHEYKDDPARLARRTATARLGAQRAGLETGRPIKSTNHYYTKRKAELQAALGHEGTTARVQRFTAKRTRRITHSLPTASTAISALLVAEGSGTLVVGNNPGWQQEAA